MNTPSSSRPASLPGVASSSSSTGSATQATAGESGGPSITNFIMSTTGHYKHSMSNAVRSLYSAIADSIAVRREFGAFSSASPDSADIWMLGVNYRCRLASPTVNRSNATTMFAADEHGFPSRPSSSASSDSSNIAADTDSSSAAPPPPPSQPPPQPHNISGTNDGTSPVLTGYDTFYDDFISRLWFTYRARYPAIAGSSFTTDSGWGCMLRAGQMILAQALMVRSLGREWKRPSDNQPIDEAYQQIVSWFLDELSASTPFSIHHMTALGKQFGKNVGEWFGPHGTANVIKELTKDHAESDMAVHIVPDGVVYRDLVLEDAATGGGGGGEFKPVLILVTTRLGIDFLNPYYYPFITSCLMNPSCVGIGGGKPSSALYIVGYFSGEPRSPVTSETSTHPVTSPAAASPLAPGQPQRSSSGSLAQQQQSFGQPRSDTILLYLDPHYTRPAIPAGTTHSDLTREQLDTYHCTSVRRVPISKLDPSMMIGFLVRTKSEFEQLCQAISSDSQGLGLVLSVADTAPSYRRATHDSSSTSLSKVPRSTGTPVAAVTSTATNSMTDSTTSSEEPAAEGVASIEEQTSVERLTSSPAIIDVDDASINGVNSIVDPAASFHSVPDPSADIISAPSTPSASLTTTTAGMTLNGQTEPFVVVPTVRNVITQADDISTPTKSTENNNNNNEDDDKNDDDSSIEDEDEWVINL